MSIFAQYYVADAFPLTLGNARRRQSFVSHDTVSITSHNIDNNKGGRIAGEAGCIRSVSHAIKSAPVKAAVARQSGRDAGELLDRRMDFAGSGPAILPALFVFAALEFSM